MEIYDGKWIVYIHVNKINAKMYVGITSRKPETRYGKAGSGYIHCAKFWRAIQKYGWDSFEHYIFASNLTKDEACNMEKLLIEKLDTIKCGYNLDKGGFASEHSESTIEKIRNANKGKTLSKETKEKIKEARTRQIISHESIMKSAEKNRGKKRSDKFKEESKKH